jgi:methyltransferase (TIGR00027 family)
MDNTTAKVSCFARAYHYKNNTTHIFADSCAQKILGEEYAQIAESMAQGINFFMPGFKGSKEDGLRLIVDNQLSPSVLGRSAFCERKLSEAEADGCRQYVLFAAGYDTYALRNTDASVKVYELDLPEMVEDKRSRMGKLGKESSATYVRCNLAEETWPDKLLEKGFKETDRAFGSLLGISYYLEKEEWERLLRSVAGITPKGSRICFDYPLAQESKETIVNKALASGAGERMKALYTEAGMRVLLTECGFRVTEHLEASDMTEEYFADYNKNTPEHPMKAPEGIAYVLAVRI